MYVFSELFRGQILAIHITNIRENLPESRFDKNICIFPKKTNKFAAFFYQGNIFPRKKPIFQIANLAI